MLGAPTPMLVAARLSVKYVPTSAGSSVMTYPFTPLTAPPEAFHSRRATPPPFDGRRTVAVTVRPAACAGIASRAIEPTTIAAIDTRTKRWRTDMTNDLPAACVLGVQGTDARSPHEVNVSAKEGVPLPAWTP